MNNRDVPRIEKALPRRFRGRSGYRRLLDGVRLRVSVSGVRGKSGLVRMTDQALRARGLSVYAKETGTDPVSYKDGVPHAIPRDPHKKALMEETLWEVKTYWPMDAVVLENQAITPYTMRIFNEGFCRAQYLLVTNVRRDHLGTLGRAPDRIARAFGQSAPPGCVVVSGERDPALRTLIEREANERDARFLNASPRQPGLPGLECLTVLDALLWSALGEGLSREEWLRHENELRGRFRWTPSRLHGVKWFDGAEINDVDSTGSVLNYLQRTQPLPVNFVAYFRRDRLDRTASFVPFLRRALEEGVAVRAYVSGHGSQSVARRLSGWPVHVIHDRADAVPGLLDRLGRECRDQAVMTIANAVPPWPRAVAAGLRLEGGKPASAGPAGLESFSELEVPTFAQRVLAHRAAAVEGRPVGPPPPFPARARDELTLVASPLPGGEP